MLRCIIVGIVFTVLAYVIAFQRSRFSKTVHELEVKRDGELCSAWRMGYEAGYKQGNSDRALKNLGYKVPK